MSKEKDNKKFDYLLKYIIIGDSAVGKSNLLLRYVFSTFKSEYKLTIGVEFGEKTELFKGKSYRIQIWDTAGQEQFRSITRTYYKNSVCAIVVYDITRRETFNNILTWIEDCKNNSPKTIYIILVGNKCDLEEDRQVTTEEGEEIATKYGLLFLETSAKTVKNVNEIFSKSIEYISEKIENNYYDIANEECGIKQINQPTKLTNKKKKKKKGFC